MDFLNDLAPYLGIAILLFVWKGEKFNTKPLSIQLTMIVWLIAMMMSYLADQNAEYVPVFSSAVTRYLDLLSIILVAWYVYIVSSRLSDYSLEAKDYKAASITDTDCIKVLSNYMSKEEQRNILTELQTKINESRENLKTLHGEDYESSLAEQNTLINTYARLDVQFNLGKTL